MWPGARGSQSRRGSATYLKNDHGVVIKLLATSQGLRFNLSGNGVTVKLKS